jgi:hypothetical protein
MLAVSVAAIPAMAAVTGAHTPPGFAVLALAVGIGVGLFQGSNLAVERAHERLLARRSALAVGAWGAGIIVAQGAGLANRTGVLEAGQALAYFGAASSFGLIVGRMRVVNALSLAASLIVGGTLVAALTLGAGEEAAAQAPTPTPAPKLLKPAGTIDGQPYLNELQKGLPAGTLVQSTRSQLTLEFTDSGGAVKGDGQFVMEGFRVGVLIAIAQDLGSAVGEAVGGAIAGAASLGTAGGGSSSGAATKLPPDLENCRGDWTFTFKLDGAYDKAAGSLKGTYTAQQLFSDLRSCPVSANDITKPQLPSKAQPWSATFDGTTVTGQLTSTQQGTPSLPFTARVAEDKPSSGAGAGAAAPPQAGASPSSGSGEPSEGLLPPPIEVPGDITAGEAAGVGLVGLAAVGLVAVAATAQTAGTSLTERPKAPEPETAEAAAARPRPPQPNTPDTIGVSAINIRKIAEDRGWGDIVDAIDRRRADGTLTAADLDALRNIIHRREGLGEAMGSGKLWTQSDASAFLEGSQQDAATIADWMGHPEIGWAIRRPGTAARIAAAVASGGWSEVPMTAWDWFERVRVAADTPGDTSTMAAVTELGTATAIEVATNVVLPRVIEEGGKAALGAAMGSADDVLKSGMRAGEEAAETGVRAGEEGAEAGLRNADEGAGGGTLRDQGEPAPPPAEAAGKIAEGEDAAIGSRTTDPDAPRLDGEPKAAGIKEPVTPLEPPAAPAVGRPGDNTWLKQAPDGTKIPPERLPEAGYTREQGEAIRDIAGDEKVLVGTRTTNVYSPHLDGEPKWVDIKAKTTNDIDIALGAGLEDRGKVSLFKPNDPGVRSGPVWDRYQSRLSDYEKLKPDVDKLVADGKVTWDPKTGVIYDAKTRKPFIGDIDAVYIRDAESGDIITTGDRYDRVMQRLMDSPARLQHRAEVTQLTDQLAMKGATPEHFDEAMKLAGNLSGAHERAAETVIETSGAGWQKGPSPLGMADIHSPVPGGFLRRGLPMDIPSDDALRASGQLPPRPE